MQFSTRPMPPIQSSANVTARRMRFTNSVCEGDTAYDVALIQIISMKEYIVLFVGIPRQGLNGDSLLGGRGAQPTTRLQGMYQSFLKRMMQRNERKLQEVKSNSVYRIS
jgi:hypothetical protein